MTILDDDPPPVVHVADAVTVEGTGGLPSLVFTLTLSAPSGRSVTVAYATQDHTFSLPGKTLPGVASAPGLYRLLVDLSTWRSGAPEARQWADKLAKRGRLWTAPVSLSPVPV